MAKKHDLAPGGQAIIEGVMMRSEQKLAAVVRLENGKLVSKKDKIRRLKPFWRLPFIRGISNLLQMLILGTKTLVWSSNQFLEEEEEISGWGIFWLLFVSFGFAALLFIALPYFLTDFFGVKEASQPIIFNLIDGIIKIALFVAYVYVISFMNDVKRLFEYHGAEHAAVHCYEHGSPLTVANCARFTTLHPRCGTSFIMIVLIISILVLSIIPLLAFSWFPGLETINVWIQKLILLPVRILFIFPIASIAYELHKLTAKWKDNILMKVLTLPGLAVQRITTRKPDKKQLEVAIKALKAVTK